MSIDSTVGGEASNSYVSLEEADAYFPTVFGRAAWDDVDSDVKEQLLVSSTQALDSFISWSGTKYTEEQFLEWPRAYAYDKNGRVIPTDVIPKDVKTATFELAFYINTNGGMQFEPNTLSEVKVGSVDVKFANYVKEVGIPKFIETMLASLGLPMYADGNSVKMVKLERV